MSTDTKLWDIAYEQYETSGSKEYMTFGQFYGGWAPTAEEFAAASHSNEDAKIAEAIDADIDRQLTIMRRSCME